MPPTNVGVIDIGKPGRNFGWALRGPTPSYGTDVDECVSALAASLGKGPLALGFEAPMFVPVRDDPTRVLSARHGECVGGVNRPFSAAAGASALVTGLVVVTYVLQRLRNVQPNAVATLDWTAKLDAPGSLLLFEAFVTNQKKGHEARHVEDAWIAIEAFERVMTSSERKSAIDEPSCLNTLGAIMLRTGWTTDLSVLAQPALVVRG